MQNPCAQPLTPLALRGISLFNEGQYYQCHHDLEEAWRGDKTPGRNLHRAILQIGVALYQIERENYRGAVKMLRRARKWLALLPATCRGIDVISLRHTVDMVETAVRTLGPDHLANFDWTIIPHIHPHK